MIRSAISLAKWVPSEDMLDYLVENAGKDERAMRANNVLLELRLQGASLPIALKAQQRAEQSIERAPSRGDGDVEGEIDRLLNAHPSP